MNKIKIFGCWQSDNNDSKNYFLNILKSVCKECDCELFLAIDRNSSGAPNIYNEILNKINKCNIFVCDLTIIDMKYQGRKTPNPNVMFELGYATSVLGEDNIICLYDKAVCDKNFKIEMDMPFDIRQKNLVEFNSNFKKSLNQDRNYFKIKNIIINTIDKNRDKFTRIKNTFEGNHGYLYKLLIMNDLDRDFEKIRKFFWFNEKINDLSILNILERYTFKESNEIVLLIWEFLVNELISANIFFKKVFNNFIYIEILDFVAYHLIKRRYDNETENVIVYMFEMLFWKFEKYGDIFLLFNILHFAGLLLKYILDNDQRIELHKKIIKFLNCEKINIEIKSQVDLMVEYIKYPFLSIESDKIADQLEKLNYNYYSWNIDKKINQNLNNINNAEKELREMSKNLTQQLKSYVTKNYVSKDYYHNIETEFKFEKMKNEMQMEEINEKLDSKNENDLGNESNNNTKNNCDSD